MSFIRWIFILAVVISCNRSEENNLFAEYSIRIDSLQPINQDNQDIYTLSGLCAEEGKPVSLVITDINGVQLEVEEFPMCEENGGWYMEMDMSALEEGEIQIVATIIDDHGNVHEDKQRIMKDTSPLLLTANHKNILVSNSSAYTLQGACSEEGRPVEIELSDESSFKMKPQEVVSCQDGSWMTILNTNSLRDGEITISAIHRDLLDEPFYLDFKIIKDTSTPMLEINPPSNIIADIERNYSISGTCSDNGQAVQLTLRNITGLPNETSPFSQSRCQNGLWSAKFSTARLQDGIDNIRLTAVHYDVAGNTYERTAIVSKDVIKPNVIINTPSNIFLTTATQYNLDGLCSEDQRSISISFEDSAPTPNILSTSQNCVDEEWSLRNYDVSSLEEGRVTIRISQEDDLRNITEKTVVVQKSNSNLAVTVNNVAHIRQSNVNPYTLGGTCSPDGGRVSARIANLPPLSVSPCSSGIWSAQFNLEFVGDSDSISVTVDYEDEDGIDSAPQASTTIIKDIIPPKISIDELEEINRINDSAYLLSGDCSDHGEAIDLSVNSGAITAMGNCVNERWSQEVNIESITTSEVNFQVTHSDVAGNSSFQNKIISRNNDIIITVDRLRNISDSNESSYGASGACSEAGSEVTVTIMSVQPTPQPVCGSNFQWSFNNLDLSSLAEGSVDFTIAHSGMTITDTAYKGCYSSGTEAGTASDPIIICNYDDLKDIDNNRFAYYILGKNINADGSWSENNTTNSCTAYDGTTVPVTTPCTGMQPLSIFRGTLDGDGYEITDLYIHTSQEEVGLFREIDETAEVKNLKLRNVRIINNLGEDDFPSTGAIAGLSGSTTLINNCSVTGTIEGNNDTGGLVGYANGRISNSYSDMTVNGLSSGGIAGYLSSGVIISSYAKGTINGVGMENQAGGVAGSIDSDSIIINSFSEAIITGTGGQLGGLVGSTISSQIKNSYSLSIVRNNTSGALLGDLTNPADTTMYTLSDIYWNTDLTIQANGVGNAATLLTSSGLTTTEMQQACPAGSSAAICSLGDGFSFQGSAYPQVKECLDCSPNNPVYSTELVPGQ